MVGARIVTGTRVWMIRAGSQLLRLEARHRAVPTDQVI